jgi:hypothetical protein
MERSRCIHTAQECRNGGEGHYLRRAFQHWSNIVNVAAVAIVTGTEH